MNAVIDTIKKYKVIAIVRNVAPDNILETARALFDGGIRLMEVTFNQSSSTCEEDTQKSIRTISENFGDKVCVGAGTVMTEKQVEAAVNAGAKYIISPNTDADVIRKTKELGAVSIPGVFSPSEITAAHKIGADFVKIFPADVLGVSYIKAVTSPISHIPILAVGGINEENLAEYMRTGICGVGVGSNLVNNKLISQGKFSELTKLAEKYTNI